MALTLETDNWAAQDDEVAVLTEAGELEQAMVLLEQQTETQPGFADTYLRLGDLHAQLKQHDDAIENYVRAIDLHPDYLEASSKLGAELLRVGRPDQAAKWFTHSVDINDRLLAAYAGLGFAQFRTGSRSQAEASLRMALGVEPNSSLLFSEVARIRQNLAAIRRSAPLQEDAPGDTEDARAGDDDWLAQEIERYRQRLGSRPNHAHWHYELALLLRHAGEVEKAISHYGQVVTINAAYAKAWTKLALLRQQQDQWEETVDALERGIDPGRDLIRLHYELALSFTLPARFDLTLEHLEQTMDAAQPIADVGANIQLALETVGLVDVVSV